MNPPIYPDIEPETILPNEEGITIVSVQYPNYGVEVTGPYAACVPFRSSDYGVIRQLFFADLSWEQKFHTHDNPGSPYEQWITHDYYSSFYPTTPRRLVDLTTEDIYHGFFRSTVSFPSPAETVYPARTDYNITLPRTIFVGPPPPPWDLIASGQNQIEVANPINADRMGVDCWYPPGYSDFYHEQPVLTGTGNFLVTWPAEKKFGGGLPVLLLPILAGLAVSAGASSHNPNTGRRWRKVL